MTDQPDRGDLIRHALGSGLHGLLPGQDHATAIKSWSATTWHGSDGSGEVNRSGIAWYPSLEAHRAGKPGLTISWRDIISIIERGCGEGRREAYEEAWKAYVEQSGAPLPEPWTPAYLLAERGLSKDSFFQSEANQAYWAKTTEVGRGLRAAADAIVTAGVTAEPVQELLW